MLTETLEPPTMVPPMIAPPMVDEPKEFDWITTLEEIIKGRTVDSSELDFLKQLASGWPTCACGQLCRLLPRHMSGQPHDGALTIHGLNFYDAIADRDWHMALKVFHRIEYRTTHLLKEMASC